jgi:RNA polymerase sigma factor (sigma-70 family)
VGEHDAEAWISAGDWEVLYRRYFSRIARYCARSGGDSGDAEDLAQQVFVELARAKVPEEPLPYLQAIARNVLAQYRRRRATEQAALAGYLGYKQIAAEGSQGQEVTGDPPPGDSRESVKGTLMAVVRKLPPKDAELVTLRFLEGLSTKQVAQRMSCSEDGVRKRVERLRVVLRRLEPE